MLQLPEYIPIVIAFVTEIEVFAAAALIAHERCDLKMDILVECSRIARARHRTGLTGLSQESHMYLLGFKMGRWRAPGGPIVAWTSETLLLPLEIFDCCNLVYSSEAPAVVAAAGEEDLSSLVVGTGTFSDRVSLRSGRVRFPNHYHHNISCRRTI